MDREALIHLSFDDLDDCVLVTSSEFPLLNLTIADDSEREIARCVLPVLKEMVEFKVQAPVDLRLVPSFDGRSEDHLPAPHVIATKMAPAHVG